MTGRLRKERFLWNEIIAVLSSKRQVGPAFRPSELQQSQQWLSVFSQTCFGCLNRRARRVLTLKRSKPAWQEHGICLGTSEPRRPPPPPAAPTNSLNSLSPSILLGELRIPGRGIVAPEIRQIVAAIPAAVDVHARGLGVPDLNHQSKRSHVWTPAWTIYPKIAKLRADANKSVL